MIKVLYNNSLQLQYYVLLVSTHSNAALQTKSLEPNNYNVRNKKTKHQWQTSLQCMCKKRPWQGVK